MGQGSSVVRPSSTPPPPVIDTVFAGYEGVPGVLATVGVLAVTGAAAYLGIKTGLEAEGKTKKALGWVAGVGSALLGLLYLGGKSGLTIGTGAPAVNVYPA
jgi:hypothetical protein